MSRSAAWLWVYLLLICAVSVLAQQPSTVVVPPLVNFSGVLTDVNGKPLIGVVGVTFFLYQEQQGGSPLWMETQNVYPDKTGHYTVMLGSTSSSGMPSQLFANGEARWLGVQPQGQPEQPRVSLLSVPYAMKAVDAETLGGMPASAFARTLSSTVGGTTAATAQPNKSATTAQSSGLSAAPSVSGSGTKSFIPIWTSSTALGNSLLFQSSAGNLGVSTTTPTQKFQVDLGNALVKGTDNFKKTGDTAYMYVGDANHPVEAIYGSGLAIGTYKVPQAVFIQDKTGYVGIGTTTPAAALDVNGTANFTSSSGSGVVGSSSSGDGVDGYGSGSNSGVYGYSSSGYGVAGTSGSGGGVYGYVSGTSSSSVGVYGYGNAGIGVYGLANGYESAGVLGYDTGTKSSGVAGENDGELGYGVTGEGSGADGVGVRGDGTIVGVWGAPSSGPGNWAVFGEGDIGASGTITGGQPLPDDRVVSLYAMQSPENWFEDAGSGQLSNGSASIALDPTFAQTVNTGVEYHVFLTPKGDCEGLYVSHETSQGFEVHELRGGRSSIAFDYRIMAKRHGYETVRLADVTELYKKLENQKQMHRERMEQRRAARSAARPIAAPVTPKPK